MVTKPQRTKLLVATIGLATVTYVGCSNASPPGNTVAPPQEPTEAPPGNLMAPPDVTSASPTSVPTATVAEPIPSASAVPSSSAVPMLPRHHPPGNLMPPPPPPLKKP